MPTKPKPTATPQQLAALAAVVKSFDVNEVMGGGNFNWRAAYWFLYFCSLRAEVSTGKVQVRALKARRSALYRVKQATGQRVTLSAAREYLTGRGVWDDCLAEVLERDLARLDDVSTAPRRRRRPTFALPVRPARR